ncbi:MAG: glutamine synthetase [Flavobacteriia bacterium]|nr:MAG: glutamine synthetase [Flavobacteriia bacterium]
MKSTSYQFSPNALEKYLEKPAAQFNLQDIVSFVEAHNIEMINLRYVAGDGRLKTLNFNINSRAHLEEILMYGERVDGSSLFSHIEAGSSDMYVVPRYKTAFLNPFADIPTLDILCSFFDGKGEPMKSSPEVILHKAHQVFTERTGYTFEAMGELEYYIITEKEDHYTTKDQRGYHESFPFNKSESFRMEAMNIMAKIGCEIKYGHSEVGNFSDTQYNYEQNEIEFLPVPVEDAADQLALAKWVLRSLAYAYDYELTFAPKITLGKAGSGMHIHMRLMKDGQNAMIDKGQLSDVAKRMIAGLMDLAPSLTAFGNTNPTSYFRLVPHQEAPTSICWGDRNRSVLVRVPLGWTGDYKMAQKANPNVEISQDPNNVSRQTVEFRCSDGSADVYLLLAGLTVAARHGLEMSNALELAEQKYVGVNIFEKQHADVLNRLDSLPVSCHHSAKKLDEQREIYTKYNVFDDSLIDDTVKTLKDYNDKNLREEMRNQREDIKRLVSDYFHCG